MNRDVEILKIQVLADYYHNRSNLLLSFILTVFITFSITFMTLSYEGHISLPVYYVSLGAVFVLVFYGLYTLDKGYSKWLDRIDDLLRQVEKGEVLPSLRELRNTKK
jgi:hypothetical protein